MGSAMDLQASLQVRRGSLAIGLRGYGCAPLRQTLGFDIPYGTGREERTFQYAGFGATALWHAPQWGPFELGLGLEGGHLWTWDRHPAWRTDLSERTVESGAFVAGPLLELAWVSGHRLELLVAASLPVTLTDWRRDRIARQDLFPVSAASNLVVSEGKRPLMLPSLDLAARIHL